MDGRLGWSGEHQKFHLFLVKKEDSEILGVLSLACVPRKRWVANFVLVFILFYIIFDFSGTSICVSSFFLSSRVVGEKKVSFSTLFSGTRQGQNSCILRFTIKFLFFFFLLRC